MKAILFGALKLLAFFACATFRTSDGANVGLVDPSSTTKSSVPTEDIGNEKLSLVDSVEAAFAAALNERHPRPHDAILYLSSLPKDKAVHNLRALGVTLARDKAATKDGHLAIQAAVQVANGGHLLTSDIYHDFGIACQMLGLYNEALLSFIRGFALQPRDFRMAVEAAISATQLKIPDYRVAIGLLNHVLREFPDFPRAKFAVTQIPQEQWDLSRRAAAGDRADNTQIEREFSIFNYWVVPTDSITFDAQKYVLAFEDTLEFVNVQLTSVDNDRAFDVVVQVGANNGADQWSRGGDHVHRLVRQRRPKRTVLVEPLTMHNRWLSARYAGISGVEIQHVGIVTSQTKQDKLHLWYSTEDAPAYQVSSQNKNHLLAHNLSAASLRLMTVPAYTLSDFLHHNDLQHVDVLFLDMEGFEAIALKELDWSSISIDAVQVEHAHLDRESLVEFMTSKGYVVRRALYEMERTIHPADTLFVKESKHVRRLLHRDEKHDVDSGSVDDDGNNDDHELCPIDPPSHATRSCE